VRFGFKTSPQDSRAGAIGQRAVRTPWTGRSRWTGP